MRKEYLERWVFPMINTPFTLPEYEKGKKDIRNNVVLIRKCVVCNGTGLDRFDRVCPLCKGDGENKDN